MTVDDVRRCRQRFCTNQIIRFFKVTNRENCAHHLLSSLHIHTYLAKHVFPADFPIVVTVDGNST